MRCFYHQGTDAVGTCKSCGKGLCVECAVDLGKGLACRGRCEESARAIIQLVDRNIHLSTAPTKAQLVVPAPVPRSGPPTEYIASQLTTHIKETLLLRWMLGVCSAIVGVLLFVAGLSRDLLVLDIAGVCCVVFAVICFVQARRSATHPRLPETQTR